MKNVNMIGFGLGAGISAAVMLNMPMLHFKTMVPLTIWGVIGVVVLFCELIERLNGTNK